jgi:hypothetical protein
MFLVIYVNKKGRIDLPFLYQAGSSAGASGVSRTHPVVLSAWYASSSQR